MNSLPQIRAGQQQSAGGIFRIEVDGHTIWNRTEQGGFPDAKQLKQRVRDHICPDKPLGHNESQG